MKNTVESSPLSRSLSLSLSLSRRRLLAGAAVGALALAACGSDTDDGAADEDVTESTLPPVTAADDDADGAGDGEDRTGLPTEGSIVEVGYYGGFAPIELVFQSMPSVLVSADGELILPAPTPAIFPGPLLPQHTVAPVSEQGLENLVAFLEAEGMFADVSYEAETFIADASTATVLASTADETFRHEAYALGLDGGLDGAADESPERQQLAAVINALLDPVAVIGADEVGESVAWTPDAYQLFAQPVGDLSVFDMPPTVVEWPASTGVVLADTPECVEVDRDSVGELLEGADQLTFFSEGDSTYQVIARPAYPGRDCPGQN